MVAKLKNTREALRNHIQKNIDFLSKIEPKLIEKSRKTTLAAKFCKKTLLGAHVSPKSRVFVDFWAPAGFQKSQKTVFACAGYAYGRPLERNFSKVLLKLLAEGSPDAKNDPI